jgi:hypothetical protein
MDIHMHNLASVIAAGFVAVYLKSSVSEEQRHTIVANLTNVLDTVYGHGFNRAQLDFASRLAGELSKNTKISAQELLALASSSLYSVTGKT